MKLFTLLLILWMSQSVLIAETNDKAVDEKYKNLLRAGGSDYPYQLLLDALSRAIYVVFSISKARLSLLLPYH